VKIGDKITRGMKLGRIGNTGDSHGIHDHLGCVHGEQKEVWHLADMERNDPAPAFRQLMYFIDSELFMFPIEITTTCCDFEYFKKYGKIHAAYDLIPGDGWNSTKHFDFYWNRSYDGTAIAVGFDSAYGYYLHVKYEV